MIKWKGELINAFFIKMSRQAHESAVFWALPILPWSGERARALSASSNSWICLINFSPLSGRAWMFTDASVL
jgi:hypothetical protein